jgi:hypothetical protein
LRRVKGGKTFQQVQGKIRSAKAVDEFVDVKYAELDIGDILGVQFPDEVENPALSVSRHNNNHDIPTVTTNASNGAPTVEIRTDVSGESLEERPAIPTPKRHVSFWKSCSVGLPRNSNQPSPQETVYQYVHYV